MEADIAMYDAKEAGRARAVVYDATEDRQERMLARMTWADRIRDALATDAFVLHAQPVMSLTGDPVPRSELLLRMLGEDGDLIPPGSFLYIAERFDLIQEIDRWVVSRAVEILAAEQAAGREVVLCVNLSAKSVTDPALPEHIARRAGGARRRRPRALLRGDRDGRGRERRSRPALRAARSASWAASSRSTTSAPASPRSTTSSTSPSTCSRSTASSSRDLTTSRTNQLVVKAVVDIARGLGKRTIAEFVEDAETLELLRGMGVDFAQGFYVAKPAPLPLVQAPLPHLENA